MDEDLQQKWDERYRSSFDEPTAVRVLVENAHLLPRTGVALDLACGLGGNARLLAKHGLETHAWDISRIAIMRLEEYALETGWHLFPRVCDINTSSLGVQAFDVIAVSYFLDRDLASPIMEALKPGGLLFYQTFTRERVSERGPGRDAFRLAPGELLTLFADLQPVIYRDEGLLGDLSLGFRDEAMLVARKPD